jgi:hypothetical protein
MTTTASHAAYRRIHLDLLLTQGSLCRRMCCRLAFDISNPSKEQRNDRHHHRRHSRCQPLHP